MKIIKYSHFSLEEDFCIYGFGHETCKPDKPEGPSMREMYIIHYIRDGAGYVNGRRLDSGHGFLIRPGTLIHYYPDRTDPWEYFWISFSGKHMEVLLKQCGLLEKTEWFECSWVEKAFSHVKNIIYGNEKAADLDLRMAGCLYTLLAFHKKSAPPLKSSDSYLGLQQQHIRDAKKYLSVYYYKKLRMSDVAEYIGINRQYLCNIFLKYEGISPQAYLIRTRIQKACELLLHNELTVSDVARMVGYDDPFYFSKIFKKNMGTSPSNFRSNI